MISNYAMPNLRDILFRHEAIIFRVSYPKFVDTIFIAGVKPPSRSKVIIYLREAQLKPHA